MKYNIKDAEGNIINTIVANAKFVEANCDYYELYAEPTPPADETARQWRDSELSATDYIVPLTDHPQRAAYMTYREALRNWPSADSFPDTRPELGE